MDEPAKYRKKPVVIEAMQYDGENRKAVEAFMHKESDPLEQKTGGNEVWIATPEGTLYASIGDWVIKGVQGEFYPCKPDIFDATYVRVRWLTR